MRAIVQTATTMAAAAAAACAAHCGLNVSSIAMKREKRKMGKKFHSTKTTRRLYCVIILDVFFSLRRLLKTRPS
jgi:hypothetical protein